MKGPSRRACSLLICIPSKSRLESLYLFGNTLSILRIIRSAHCTADATKYSVRTRVTIVQILGCFQVTGDKDSSLLPDCILLRGETTVNTVLLMANFADA